MEKAIEILRRERARCGVKREANETAEGRIGVYVDTAAKVGAIVELRCESAPSAKSDQFVALANDLAKQVAVERGPDDVDELLAQPFVGDPGRRCRTASTTWSA